MKLSMKRLAQAVVLGLVTSIPVTSIAQSGTKTAIVKPTQAAQQHFNRGKALIQKNQVAKGIIALDDAAAQGHPQAAYELAALYESGLGVQKDYNRAKHYYEVAIQQGHRDAHFNLALLYNGAGAPFDDLNRARKLMNVVAGQGDVEAQFVLATMMNTSSSNVASNPAQAIHWLGRAANRGHENAQFQLGMHYLRGDNVARDTNAAYHWFTEAAKKNVAGAHFNLALMHERGDGIPANLQSAIRWYTTAADLGNANAQQNLGIKYLVGDQIAANTSKAMALITRAATAGLRNSQLLLGQLYQSGYEGKVRVDLAKAETWYLRAAKQGQPDAQYQLALILLDKKNSKGDAKFWIKQAVAAGHQDAKKLEANL